ncbi:MAG TPA: hypothetical protein VGF14_00430 [Alphaproteobacteria bacterium]
MDELIPSNYESHEQHAYYNADQQAFFLNQATEFLTSDHSALTLSLDDTFDAARTKDVVSRLCNIVSYPSSFEYMHEAFLLLHKIHARDGYCDRLNKNYPTIQKMIVPVYEQAAPEIITHMTALRAIDESLCDSVLLRDVMCNYQTIVGCNPDYQVPQLYKSSIRINRNPWEQEGEKPLLLIQYRDNYGGRYFARTLETSPGKTEVAIKYNPPELV